METGAISNRAFSIIRTIFPGIRREHVLVQQRTERIRIGISNYKQLSQQLQDNIDGNHFASHLVYDKKHGQDKVRPHGVHSN